MTKNYKLIIAMALLITTIGNVKLIAQCTTPSSQAGTPVITCQSQTSMLLTWTAAGTPSDCNGYVVIRLTNYGNPIYVSSGTPLPTAGTTVTFAGNMDCYIEYVGGNLSTVSNVSADSQFYYYIIPYNNSIGGCTQGPAYNTDNIATVTNLNPVVGIVSNFSNGIPTTTTIPDISFSPPQGGAQGYLVCTNPNGYYAYPTNGMTYTVGQTFNNESSSPWDQTVQYAGPNTSGIIASTNLSPGVTYCVSVYPYQSEYTCSGGPIYVGTFAQCTNEVTTAFGTGIDNGVISRQHSNLILVYPNPSSEKIAISSASIKTGETVIITVIDLPGEIMQTNKIKWSDTNPLDVKTLPSGIYFLQVKTNSGCEMQRFVKQ